MDITLEELRNLPKLSPKQRDALHAEYERLQRDYTIMDHLQMLGEEASELSVAASKVQRALGDGYVTAVTYDDAMYNLIEEFADVCLMMRQVRETMLQDGRDISTSIKSTNVQDIADMVREYKIQRFIERVGGTLPEGVTPVT